mmetsp:Transcript_22378/g.76650  ORF Transcript_22378/g.76650 Transcript_22378/m.76650 type:complete len:301 (-) Transcript_22378:923-1825(-)
MEPETPVTVPTSPGFKGPLPASEMSLYPFVSFTFEPSFSFLDFCSSSLSSTTLSFSFHFTPSSQVGRSVLLTGLRPMCLALQRPAALSLAAPVDSCHEPRSMRSAPNSPSQEEPAKRPSPSAIVNFTLPPPVISPTKAIGPGTDFSMAAAELPTAGGPAAASVWPCMGPASTAPVIAMVPWSVPGKLENQMLKACAMLSASHCSSRCQRPLTASPARRFTPSMGPLVPSAACQVPCRQSWPFSSEKKASASTYADKPPSGTMSKETFASMPDVLEASARPRPLQAELSSRGLGSFRSTAT